MRDAAAVPHVLAPLLLCACTIGPAAGTDGGTASSAAPRSVVDQCEDVLTEYCQKAVTCALPVAPLKDCIDNALPLCCTGSKCNEPSPTPETVVTGCKQAIDSADCNDVANTMNPTTCLQSP
jgi:hypothetical protein